MDSEYREYVLNDDVFSSLGPLRGDMHASYFRDQLVDALANYLEEIGVFGTSAPLPLLDRGSLYNFVSGVGIRYGTNRFLTIRVDYPVAAYRLIKVNPRDVRRWASESGYPISAKGRIPERARRLYAQAIAKEAARKRLFR